jgi:hypothetical protein
VRTLCKLFIQLLGMADELLSPLPLDSLPKCMKQMLTEKYPIWDHIRISVRLVCSLGHRNVDGFLLGGWKRHIELKYHGDAGDKKKAEIRRKVQSLEKSWARWPRANKCSELQAAKMCPHYCYPDNTPSAALIKCFGAGKVPVIPTPVEFVKIHSN